jgi:hypothetical protein
MNKAEWAVGLILPVALVRHQIRGRLEAVGDARPAATA